jgi:YYY domain-containing protein
MQTRSLRLPWCLLGLFALLIRVIGLNFDQTHFFHPDERAIADAVLRLSFHPLQLNPHFFPYGSFPFYVIKAVTSLLSNFNPWFAGYDGVVQTGRFLSALWGAATVLLLALFGRRLYGEKTGLLAGLLLAGTVLHLQNSHFATNDVPLAFLVLLAVVLLTRFVDTGSRATLALAGFTAGLAVATKVSAAPILLAVAVAGLLRFKEERALGRLAAAWTLGFLALLAGFAFGEPYAFLDHRGFLHDVVEQSHMVRTAGLFPFTNQYIGVPKYLYELREFVVWGAGPLLGLAALAGTLLVLRRARSLGAGELIALSWVLPVFAIIGSFDVKFPRYMLPLYPFLVLWGAAWLEALAQRGRAGRLVRGAVVAGTLVYAAAFLSIYTRPHSAVTASEWFYAHVPTGSRVAIQDWDEGFPLPLPGLQGDRYRIVSLSLYAQDGPEKADVLSREMAAAEYLVFQTKRIYGAVTRAPEKFPLTNRAFRLLFAGDLGYTLVKDVASRPGLLGVTLPTELADESFSVYDHPKALVFHNTGHLDAGEIRRRMETATPSRSLSRRDLLLARPGLVPGGAAAEGAGEGGLPDGIRSGFVSVLLVVLLVEVLGLAAFAIFRAVVPDRPGLYALSKVLGFLLFVYLSWLVVSLRLVSLGQGPLLGTAVLLVAAGWRLRRRRPPATELWGERAVVEAVVWATFLFFLVARAFNPEIFWGEKPMDFAFLNVLYRTPTLPPPEPWFSGSTLSYAYFGHYAMAAIGKALGIHPGVMFNIGIALAASLTAAALLSAGTVLGRSVRAGLSAVGIALFLGNLSGIREVIARRTINWDYFWATSRVVPDTFDEYPFWSFLFADLHSHMLVMPFTVGFVALLLVWITRRRDGLSPLSAGGQAALVLLSGLFLGAIEVTNGWSTPTYVLLTFFLLGTDWLLSLRKSGVGLAGAVGQGFAGFAVPAAVIVVLGPILFRPFWAHFVSPPNPNWGREVGPWAKPSDFLTIWGFLFILAVPFLFWVWRGVLLAPEGVRLSRSRRAALLSVALLLLVSLLRFRPFGQALSVRTLMVGLFAIALFLLLHPRSADAWRLPLALIAYAFAILAGAEFVFIWDRANTLFKFYLEAWFFLSLAGAVIWRMLFSNGEAVPGRRLFRLAALAAGTAALFTAVSGFCGLLRQNRVDGPRGTLDGTEYLRTFAPAEGAAFDWMNRHIRGIPTLVEAAGSSYQAFSRVAMNTGLPIVMGWEYHVQQRGHTRGETSRRAAAVETIYTSKDDAAVGALLKAYGVAYVYVGPLERKTYAGANLEEFGRWDSLMTPVYRNSEVTIFAVKGAPRSAPLAAAVETENVPPPATAASPAGERQAPPGVFGQPRGVAVGTSGDVYLCDFESNRIQKLSPRLTPVVAWGTRGSGPGQFKDPCGVAVSSSGEVFVADTWNSRIQVFNEAGAFRREWGSGFFGPRGVAVDAQGSVWVSDTGNSRVVRFDASGKKELEFGKRGSGPGELNEPNGLAVDTGGRVFVCDNGNGRVAVFGRDGSFLRTFPVPGWLRAVFSEPNITIDEKGTLWVTVPLQREVRGYSPEGKLLATLRGDGSAGPAFSKPVGIALMPDGKLLVTDIENRLVLLARPR